MNRRDLLRRLVFLPFAGPILAKIATTPSYGPGTVLVGRMAGPPGRWSVATMKIIRGDWDIPNLAFKADRASGGGWIVNAKDRVYAFVLRNGDVIDFGPHVR